MRRSTYSLLWSLVASDKSGRLLYQHGFHAGNFADVVKHSVLIQLLQNMQRKESPFTYVETHSGAGLYDISSLSKDSGRPPEHLRGISMLLQRTLDDPSITLPPPTRFLLDLVDELSNDNQIVYPGSPWIASRLCRNVDSIVLCENAPDQFKLLENALGNDPRTKLLLDNGYKALKRPDNISSQQRALIFIDPPYQLGSDTEQIATLVTFLQKHWRSARIAIWHPLSCDNVEKTIRLYEAIQKATKGSECLAAEIDSNFSSDVGSGMLMVQPPYGLKEDLDKILPRLGQLLRTDNESEPNVRVKWLT